MIPERFVLGGIPVTTAIDNTLVDREETIGQADYQNQRIVLDDSKTPRETVEQGFFHEFVHWILFMMCEHELQNNEQFVDRFAHFLYQGLKTAEYEEET